MGEPSTWFWFSDSSLAVVPPAGSYVITTGCGRWWEWLKLGSRYCIQHNQKREIPVSVEVVLRYGPLDVGIASRKRQL